MEPFSYENQQNFDKSQNGERWPSIKVSFVLILGSGPTVA